MSKKNKNNPETNEKKKEVKKNKKPVNVGKILQKAVIWLMLIVMVAFFVASIVWGLN